MGPCNWLSLFVCIRLDLILHVDSPPRLVGSGRHPRSLSSSHFRSQMAPMSSTFVMQNPFLITRFVFFGESAFGAAKILIEISLSVPGLLVNVHLLSITFTSLNINATLTNGLPGMGIVFCYAMLVELINTYSTCRHGHLSVQQLYYYSMHPFVRLSRFGSSSI